MNNCLYKVIYRWYFYDIWLYSINKYSIQMSILCPKFIWNSLWLANMRSLQSEFQLVTSFFHKINAFFFRVFSKLVILVLKTTHWDQAIFINALYHNVIRLTFLWQSSTKPKLVSLTNSLIQVWMFFPIFCQMTAAERK